MMEEILTELDAMGLEYTEDYDAGIVTVDIANADKSLVIQAVGLFTSYDIDFTIDEASIVATMDMVEETPMEEAPVEEDMQEMALGEMLGGM